MKEAVDNLQKMTDEELIKAEFIRRFSTWNIPIESLENSLDEMSNEDRQVHYLELKEMITKPAFKREFNEWKRLVTRTLSLGASQGQELSEVHKIGLRFLLTQIDLFQERLAGRARLLVPPKLISAPSKKL